MIGTVDDRGRALIDVAVSNEPHGDAEIVGAWVDTAFDGHLVFPQRIIEQLQLEPLAETEAILADGSIVTLETFLVYLDWFATRVPLQVIANEGTYPLLGTELLKGRVLHIDYVQKQLTLE